MGIKEITKKFSTMELNQNNHRNNKSFKKKEQTKYKMQACKKIVQACYDLKIEVPEKVLHIEKSLTNTYDKIWVKAYNKNHFTANGKPHTRKHTKKPISLARDIILV